MQAEFEKKLSKTFLIRRLAEIGFIFLFAALSFVSYRMLETNQTSSHIEFAAFSLSAAIVSAAVLLYDFVYCRFKSIQKDAHSVTVCRGMFHWIVSVDGEETARFGPFSFTQAVSVQLSTGVTATIHFSRTIWVLAYITFSDHSTSVEL